MRTIHYQLTHNEAAGTAFRRRMARPSVWAFMAVLLVIALGLALVGSFAREAAPYFAIVALVYPFALYFGLSSAISRAPWLTAPTTLEFDDQGIRMSMGDVANEMRWRVFTRWTRTQEHFFLYPGSGPNALTIPLRAFDPPTLDDFTRRLERIGRAV